jgi:uncharacterized protein YlbG (UPF0298 family)
MKKLLLAVPFSILLTACNGQEIEELSVEISTETRIKDVAQRYCEAIKAHNFKDAQSITRHDVLSNRVAMYESDKTKYLQLFKSQNCTVKSIENISAVAYEVHFSNSRLDSVQVGWSERKEQYYIFGDSFENDFK